MINFVLIIFNFYFKHCHLYILIRILLGLICCSPFSAMSCKYCRWNTYLGWLAVSKVYWCCMVYNLTITHIITMYKIFFLKSYIDFCWILKEIGAWLQLLAPSQKSLFQWHRRKVGHRETTRRGEQTQDG